MKRSIEEIEDILFSGSSEEIELLFETSDEAISYSLSEDDMVTKVGNKVSRLHGVHYEPNCIDVFGKKCSP